MISANPMDNPLSKLRDIHLPEPVSAWPPAPGWWILAILSISLIIWISWKLWKRYQQRHLLRISNRTITELQQDYANHQNSHLLIKQYSMLLRRIALARFPRQQVASLTGTTWLEFLDKSAATNLFNSEIGQLLLNGPYQKPGTKISQIDELTTAIKLWIESVSSNMLSEPNATSEGSEA